MNEACIVLETIENFDPAHWYDVLLDGPRKSVQLEDMKMIIRNVGRAGIPFIGRKHQYGPHFTHPPR